MSFKFINDFALYLAGKNHTNLATLYLLKFCLSELVRIKKEAEQRNNLINHPDWSNFIKTP